MMKPKRRGGFQFNVHYNTYDVILAILHVSFPSDESCLSKSGD